MSFWEAVKDMTVWDDIGDTATDAVETLDDFYNELKDLFDAE